MLRDAWLLLRETTSSFMSNNGLSRGAAIAFYAITSIGPVMLLIVAVAGLALGEDAARGALMDKLRGAMGTTSAEFLQSAIGSASNRGSGVLATIIGVVSLIVTASGVFGEMQSALNTIWRATPKGDTVTQLVKARLTSLGLVVALGFLLLVSLMVGTAIAALGHALGEIMPFPQLLLHGLNTLISLIMLGLIIAAIYKVLPDTHVEWRDVLIGSMVTAVLINVGKVAIGIYIGETGIASSYGAAGSVLASLFWIYYSAQIFLLGAEFTNAYARRHGTRAASPTSARPQATTAH